MLHGSQILGIGLGIVGLLVSKEFGFHYTVAKFLGIVSSLFLLSSVVAFRKYDFYLPHSKKAALFFVLSFVALVVSLFTSHASERVTGVSLVLLWSLLSFSIGAIARAEGPRLFLERFIKTQIPFFTFIYLALLHHELTSEALTRPFFGNPNIASNFLAFSLLQIFFYMTIEPKRLLRIFSTFLGTLGVFLLFSYQSRGSILGLLVGASLFLLLNRLSKESALSFIKKHRFLVGTSILLLIIGGVFYLSQKGIASMEIRYSFWRNTLCLIKDNPLGVGPGAFEYVFVHYNGACYPAAESGEGMLVRNPHNIFLEFFAEIGILGAFSFFTFLFFLGKEVYKKLSPHPFETSWIFSLAGLITSIGFFEFPQDTPYTFFVISILCGVTLGLIGSTKNSRSSFLRVLNLASSVVLAAIFFIKAYSDHLSAHPGKNPQQNYLTACALNNENWRACVFLGLSYIDQNEFEKAEHVISLVSKNFEGHHSLMHLRGVLADKKGDIQKACEEFGKYHALFNQNSSKKDYLDKNCVQQ